MFKIDIRLRFALIALGLLVGIALTVLYGFWYALPFYLVAVVLLIGYFLMGTIQSASELMQAQQLDAAEARLALTKFPNLLLPPNRAYYNMLKANFAMARQDTKGAEEYLRRAGEVKMPTDNDAAVIQLQLANIAARKSSWGEVNSRLQVIKKLNVSEPLVLEQVGLLEKAYKNRGNVRLAQRMGMGGQRPGGKRRRPKMR